LNLDPFELGSSSSRSFADSPSIHITFPLPHRCTCCRYSTLATYSPGEGARVPLWLVRDVVGCVVLTFPGGGLSNALEWRPSPSLPFFVTHSCYMGVLNMFDMSVGTILLLIYL